MSKEEEPKGKDKDKKEETPKENDVQKDLDDILDQIKEGDRSDAFPERPKMEMESGEEKGTEGKTPSEPEPENIEEILERISEKEEAETPVQEMGVFERLAGVFVNPSAVFAHLQIKPDFIPLIIAILISMLTSMLTYDLQIDEGIKRVEQLEQLDEDQKAEIIDGIEAGRYGARRYLTIFVFAPLGVGIFYVILAAIFLFVGNIILGGKARFVQLFSTVSYAFLIPMIAGSIIKIPIMISKHTLQVNTSLSLLLSEAQKNTTLYRFLDAFDAFTIWFLMVFSIGFAIIYRFSKQKGYLSVFTCWFIYILVFKILMGSIFGGLFG
ncbi:MAG: hypothetical protein Kow0042_12800 [Calditrichia bacterium]